MSVIPFIRTPDERFAKLHETGYTFDPHYVRVPAEKGNAESLRMHYVDEGPVNSEYTFLLLHGEPTWSYLYRKVIPELTSAGYRCIAPDWIGFGKSDKPTCRSDYTYRRHLDWAKAFIETLDLKNLILFGQDWGGLIGLRLICDPDLSPRFAAAAAGNTDLPAPDGSAKASQAFLAWRNYVANTPKLSCGDVVNRAVIPAESLPAAVRQAYDAPYPTSEYQEGAREFPAIVPVEKSMPEAENNHEAWKILERWQKPFLTTFSDSDPIFRGQSKHFTKRVPGAQGQPHCIIKSAGHFLQEDKGEELGKVLADFARSLPHTSKL